MHPTAGSRCVEVVPRSPQIPRRLLRIRLERAPTPMIVKEAVKYESQVSIRKLITESSEHQIKSNTAGVPSASNQVKRKLKEREENGAEKFMLCPAVT